MLRSHFILQVRFFIYHAQFFAECRDAIDERPQLTLHDEAKCRAIALEGLILLSHLRELALLSPEEPDIAVLTCLAAFSDANDTWNTPRAQKQASLLIEDYVESGHLPALLTSMLETHVKPRFSKSKNPAITQQGRRAIDPVPSNAALHSDLDAGSKAWKYRDVYVVTVFQWVLSQLSVRNPLLETTSTITEDYFRSPPCKRVGRLSSLLCWH